MTTYTGIRIDQYGVEPLPARIFIYNNTVYKNDATNDPDIYTYFRGVNIDSASATDITVKNNLVTFTANLSEGTLIKNDALAGILTESNNLLTADPDLIDIGNPDILSRDFTPNASADKAIDARATVPVVDDFFGNARPDALTHIYDTGAVEYIAP